MYIHVSAGTQGGLLKALQSPGPGIMCGYGPLNMGAGNWTPTVLVNMLLTSEASLHLPTPDVLHFKFVFVLHMGVCIYVGAQEILYPMKKFKKKGAG